jgi:hypothetical protein
LLQDIKKWIFGKGENESLGKILVKRLITKVGKLGGREARKSGSRED